VFLLCSGGDKLPKITISELKKMPKSKKLRVYAGGEIRTVTAGWLLRQKQDVARKKRKAKKKQKR
jgi:hypothetical protein